MLQRRPSISTHGTEPSQANPPPFHTPRGIPPTESTQTTPMQILRGLRNAEIGRAHKESRHHGEPTVRPASRRGEGGGAEEEEGLDYLERRADSPGRGILLGIGRNLSKMNRVGGGLSCLRRMCFWFWNLLDPGRFEIDGLRLTAMTPSVWNMRYLTEKTSTHRLCLENGFGI